MCRFECTAAGGRFSLLGCPNTKSRVGISVQYLRLSSGAVCGEAVCSSGGAATCSSMGHMGPENCGLNQAPGIRTPKSLSWWLRNGCLVVTEISAWFSKFPLCLPIMFLIGCWAMYWCMTAAPLMRGPDGEWQMGELYSVSGGGQA